MRTSCIHALLTTTIFVLLTGCNAKDKGMNELPEISASIKSQLAFKCTREASLIPSHDPEADLLYKHARWLVKRNILKKDPAAYPPIERLLRIATAYGHDRANIELRAMLDKSQAVSSDPVNESVDLVQDLIKRGIPAGYYDMGWNLEHGYGVRADADLAFKYYRKSADMGSPEGQFLVGQKLNDTRKWGVDIANIGEAMTQCAADQGHAEAGLRSGFYFQTTKRYDAAVKYFQIGASAGSATAASSLSDAFSIDDHADPTWGLGQQADGERQRRYGAIQTFLSAYEYLNPTIPEINDIVPLPPATLPPWDGQFKWLEAYQADKAPPLPTEERIAEMARAKGLDPKTGRPSGATK